MQQIRDFIMTVLPPPPLPCFNNLPPPAPAPAPAPHSRSHEGTAFPPPGGVKPDRDEPLALDGLRACFNAPVVRDSAEVDGLWG